MRLSDASSEAAEKLVNERVRPTDRVGQREREHVGAEEVLEHGRRRLAERGVSARIARVVGGVGQRYPVGVGGRVRIALIAAVIAVIGRQRWNAYLASYRAIALSASVVLSCREQAGVLHEAVAEAGCGLVGDLVPDDPDRGGAPEPAYRRLVDGARRAVQLAEGVDFGEVLGVSGAGQRWRRAGRNWPAFMSTNGVTCAVWVNPAGANAGGVS